MASQDYTNGAQDEKIENPVIVAVVPLLAQSHLNQLLQVSCLISSYNIQVHFISSAMHNQQVKNRAQGLKQEDINKIKFHDVPFPTAESPPPNPNSRFPEHWIPLMLASLQLRKPVAKILFELAPTTRRMIIIHDVLTASAVQEATNISNAELYAFNAISAFTSFSYVWEAIGKPFIPKVEMPKDFPSREGSEPVEFTDFVKYQHGLTKNIQGVLHNTCRSIEGCYLDIRGKFEGSNPLRRWGIGPLNAIDVCSHRKPNLQDKCLEWLDKQPPKSVLFICFGTSVTLLNDQIKEIAKGIEESKTKFIWVLRDADIAGTSTGEETTHNLLQGFEERVKGRGIIVRDWAPQIDILKHLSTGGFMSHCGWNSCLESISNGVPMAAWPMHTDQPRNAILIMEMLKAGLVVREWDDMDTIVKSSRIKDVICKLMASDEGKHIRERAKDLGEMLRSGVKEGGISRIELDDFISHITR